MTTEAIVKEAIQQIVQQRPHLLFEARERHFANTCFIVRGIVPHFLKSYDKILESKAKRFLAIENIDVFTLPEGERERRYKERDYLAEEIRILNDMRTAVEDLTEQWENRYYNMLEHFRAALFDVGREYVRSQKSIEMLYETQAQQAEMINVYSSIIEKLTQARR